MKPLQASYNYHTSHSRLLYFPPFRTVQDLLDQRKLEFPAIKCATISKGRNQVCFPGGLGISKELSKEYGRVPLCSHVEAFVVPMYRYAHSRRSCLKGQRRPRAPLRRPIRYYLLDRGKAVVISCEAMNAERKREVELLLNLR